MSNSENNMADNHYTFSLVIDASCINCDMCVPECPSDSIAMEGKHYQINANTCIRCEHYYDAPNCIEVCPIGSVIIKPINS